MSLFKKSAIPVIGLALVASIAVAGSHGAGPHDAAIKARQSQMKLYAFNLGMLGAMAKGEMEYNAETAAGAAENLAKLSTMSMAAAWPQGSDNSAVDGTRALPAIWEKYPDIVEKSKAMSEAAATLADVAGTDLDALRGAIGDVGKACGGCHKPYRAEES